MNTIVEYAKAGKPCWVVIDPPFGVYASSAKLQESFKSAADSMRSHPEVCERKFRELIDTVNSREYASHRVFPADSAKPSVKFGEYVTMLKP